MAGPGVVDDPRCRGGGDGPFRPWNMQMVYNLEHRKIIIYYPKKMVVDVKNAFKYAHTWKYPIFSHHSQMKYGPSSLHESQQQTAYGYRTQLRIGDDVFEQRGLFSIAISNDYLYRVFIGFNVNIFKHGVWTLSMIYPELIGEFIEWNR